jgi:hypothetical protein
VLQKMRALVANTSGKSNVTGLAGNVSRSQILLRNVSRK